MLLPVLGRVSSWRTPPHWSRRDWLNELRAIVRSAAACAVLSYDKERGVPLAAYIYIRSLAAAWTRYRQEWCYHLHCVVDLGAIDEPVTTPVDPTHDKEAVDHLGKALSKLSGDDQRLIHQLFWGNARQRGVAATLGISQQCVSKRKARVLGQLRKALNSQSHLFSHILTVCWAVLDSLDLLPVIDLL